MILDTRRHEMHKQHQVYDEHLWFLLTDGLALFRSIEKKETWVDACEMQR